MLLRNRTLPVAQDNVLKAVVNRTNKDRNRATEHLTGARTKRILNIERESWKKTKVLPTLNAFSFASITDSFLFYLFQGLRLHQLIWDEFEPTWRNSFLCFFVLG